MPDQAKTQLTCTVADAMQLLSLSRNNVYALLNANEFETFLVGKRRLITYRSLHKWMESQVATHNAQTQQKGR